MKAKPRNHPTIARARVQTLLAIGLCGVLGWVGCNQDKAPAGNFCNQKSDCSGALICLNNICMERTPNLCDPPCDSTSQTCFEGKCIPIGSAEDRDKDGFPATVDCDDFNPAVNPNAHEYCDGIDNDCDGLTDEDCPPCQDGTSHPCGSNVGECKAGSQSCIKGRWQPCSGQTPSAEICDSKDNDCDGLADEVCPCSAGATQPCSLDRGECKHGQQTCTNGAWGSCSEPTPTPELCDGKDNDCNGTIDDGFPIGLPCQGLGECGEGKWECAGGVDLRCSSMPGGSASKTSPEICDGKDNDCDGATDEGLEADTIPNSCDKARDLGRLLDSGTKVMANGNLWPIGDEDWYKVSAIDELANELLTGCDSFHFRARFLKNDDGVALDVYRGGCDKAQLACGADTDFEYAYDNLWKATPNNTGVCPCKPDNLPDPGFNTCLQEDQVFFIRVHAPQSKTSACGGYQLELSNGFKSSPPPNRLGH